MPSFSVIVNLLLVGYRYIPFFIGSSIGATVFKDRRRNKRNVCLRHKSKCCDRTDNVTVILVVAAVRVAIVEVHVPRVAATALSRTPVATARADRYFSASCHSVCEQWQLRFEGHIFVCIGCRRCATGIVRRTAVPEEIENPCQQSARRQHPLAASVIFVKRLFVDESAAYVCRAPYAAASCGGEYSG